MRTRTHCIPCIPWLLVLASCSTPPKPPTVDESLKRPANSQVAVDLQVCRNDLQNTRILAAESGRRAESTAATLSHMVAHQRAVAVLQAADALRSQANSVYTARFDFGSSRVVIPPDVAAALVDEAKTSPLVMLRGRTNGSSDTLAESRIARERASAVRAYLVAAGVDAARIRATYQPSGDHAADNTIPRGRDLNRRVEIELYRALPVGLPSLSTTTIAKP